MSRKRRMHRPGGRAADELRHAEGDKLQRPALGHIVGELGAGLADDTPALRVDDAKRAGDVEDGSHPVPGNREGSFRHERSSRGQAAMAPR